jgi:hypothetical protein
VASGLIQILDTQDPPREAIVRVNFYQDGVYRWINKTPGAWRVLADNNEKLAQPTMDDDGSYFITFFLIYRSGDVSSCFRFETFGNILSLLLGEELEGSGTIFASGAGAMKPGPMTWKRL